MIFTIYFISQFTIEQNFLLLVFLSSCFLLKDLKVNSSIISILIPLVFIFILALISTRFKGFSFYNFIRDSVHLTTPIFAIIFGFYIVKNFTNRKIIFQAIIIYCFIISILHIFKITLNLEGEWNTAGIRALGGKGSPVEALIYALYIAFFRKKENRLFSKSFNRLFFIVTTLSLLLYLSRTTFIAVILFLISFYRITQVTRKQIFYLFGLFVFSISFMVALQFMDIKRDSKGIESFLYKLKMAPTEIFNSDIDIEDHTQLWDKWRAYEVKKALDTMNKENSVIPYIAGMGLGSLVDLGFEAPLGEEKMQYIPHIHNGYGYVFFKTGLIGLFILCIWLLYLYLHLYKKNVNVEHRMYNAIISGLGLYLLFSTLVINGIYNFRPIIPVLLGIMVGLAYSLGSNNSKQVSL